MLAPGRREPAGGDFQQPVDPFAPIARHRRSGRREGMDLRARHAMPAAHVGQILREIEQDHALNQRERAVRRLGRQMGGIIAGPAPMPLRGIAELLLALPAQLRALRRAAAPLPDQGGIGRLRGGVDRTDRRRTGRAGRGGAVLGLGRDRAGKADGEGRGETGPPHCAALRLAASASTSSRLMPFSAPPPALRMFA